MMLSRSRTKGRWIPALLVTGMVLVGTPSVSADPGQTCTPVRGKFDSQPVPPPDCASPLAFCTSGNLRGGIVGSYSFTMATAMPAGDVTVPGINFYTGVSLVEVRNRGGGSLVLTDTGTVDLNPFGTGRMAAILTITDGADGFEGASGHLVLTGWMDLATGEVAGNYEGELCLP